MKTLTDNLVDFALIDTIISEVSETDSFAFKTDANITSLVNRLKRLLPSNYSVLGSTTSNIITVNVLDLGDDFF
jgi:hypothetical protein